MAYTGEGRGVAGFAVRLLRLINASFPHPGHRIANAARDATPAQNMLMCLFTRLSTHADLVLLEFGSLALHLKHWAAKAIVRALLALPAPPVVSFFTIRSMCYGAAASNAFTVSSGPNEQTAVKKPYTNMYAPNTTTAWTRAELTFSGLCSHYGVGCVSLWNAVSPHMYRRKENFSLSDVARDCLHPVNGRFGVDYLCDTLAFWFKSTMALGSVQAGLAVARIRSAAVALPPPMIHETPTQFISSKCLSFGGMGSTRSGSVLSQGFLDINWRTASVHTTDAAAAVAVAPNRARVHPVPNTTAECDAAAAPVRGGAQGFSACAWQRNSRCPAWDRASELKVWALCTRALSKSKKRSKGVVAVAAGAMLEMVLDTRMARQHERKDALIGVALEHLVSYEGMGVASLACVRNCKCAEQRVNSLVVSRVHNESVFATHAFNISGARHPHSSHAGAGTDEAGAGILRPAGHGQGQAARPTSDRDGGCLHALSSGESDGSGGPKTSRRHVEGHHHADLLARVGRVAERLDGVARVGASGLRAASLDRARLRTLRLRRQAWLQCHISHGKADHRHLDGHRAGLHIRVEQPGALVEHLLDQEVLDRVEGRAAVDDGDRSHRAARRPSKSAVGTLRDVLLRLPATCRRR